MFFLSGRTISLCLFLLLQNGRAAALGALDGTGASNSNANSTQAGVFLNSTEPLLALALDASTRTVVEVSAVTQIQGGATITAVVTNNIVQVFPVTTQTVLVAAPPPPPPAQTAVGGQLQAPGAASTVTIVTVVTAAAGVPCPAQGAAQTVTQLLTLTVTASAAQSVVLNPGAVSPLQGNGSDVALVNGTAALALGTGTGTSSQPGATAVIVDQEAVAADVSGNAAEKLRERRVRRGPRRW